MSLTLTKHHGLGNDFLVLFADRPPTGFSWASIARQLCDRRRGVGADGLLVGVDDGQPGLGDVDVTMVLFNADGSRAEMSGNGIRCFAQALARRTGSLADQLVLTDAGDRLVQLTPTDDADTIEASVDMGPVERLGVPAQWETLGCHPDRPVAHLGLGNPHSVVGVDSVAEVDLAALGAKVPQVNLEIVEPGEQPHVIRMRVHERGAGITEACGTGACASAYAAASWGLATPREGKLIVQMDGGSATVELDAPAPGRVTLTGPATYVATIEIEV